MTTLQCVRTLVGHTGFVFSVKPHQNTSLIVSGSFDCTVKIWDSRDPNCVNKNLMGNIPAHADAVVSVDISPEDCGATILSGSLDGVVRTWDMKSTSTPCTSSLHYDNFIAVSSCCYTPNPNYVLVSTLDHTHRLWDINERSSSKGDVACDTSDNSVRSVYPAVISNSGNPNGVVRAFNGHVNSKYNLFSKVVNYAGNDGKSLSFLCSGSEDGNVYLWDVNGSPSSVRPQIAPCNTLTGHTGIVYYV